MSHQGKVTFGRRLTAVVDSAANPAAHCYEQTFERDTMGRSVGNWIAAAGALLLAGTVGFSEYTVSQSTNSVACSEVSLRKFADEAKNDPRLAHETLVIVPGHETNERVFTLPGSLCTALNRSQYLSNEQVKKAPNLTLFVDDLNTRIAKTVSISADERSPGDWIFLDWKIRDVLPIAKDKQLLQKSWRSVLEGADFVTGRRLVTIGLGDGAVDAPALFASSNNEIALKVFDPLFVVAGVVGLMMVAVGLVVSNKDSGLLRDGVGHAMAVVNGAHEDYLTTFSLSKFQMGLWLFLTLGCFILLWVVTGRYSDIVTTETLTLLGMQGASGLASVLIDKDDQPSRSSGNFFEDILWDGTSVSLHRIQMLAWTFVLAMIFIWSVISTLSFPKFDTNLLLLAGIANGYYLGFKWPEPKPA